MREKKEENGNERKWGKEYERSKKERERERESLRSTLAYSLHTLKKYI